MDEMKTKNHKDYGWKLNYGKTMDEMKVEKCTKVQKG
jgi:hypothetical protein